ncbi:hypothetical protein VS868_06630 [Salinimicrobium sp. 3283s]|uniref:hypothetical protein n=1 Tax=Salinimicrobium sp. 3283s TaxID=3114359 RepID=UPI0031E8831D
MKNLKLSYLTMVLGLVLMSSCKDEKTATESTPQQTAETSTQAANSEEVKVNPAHGLPGHRCDLPVGAPLTANSAGTTSPAVSSPAPSTSVSPVRVDQTPQVNPPHGEPGHDCTIPVGAPLQK